jgi:hypothetical protein
MNNTMEPHDPKEKLLWEIARKRAAFKSHLFTYLLVNAFLWALWFFSGRHESGYGVPWPIWPTLGWGIGLVSHYIGAYVYPQEDAVQREYEKLKNKK